MNTLIAVDTSTLPVETFDFLIIGSGVAGLSCALELAEHLISRELGRLGTRIVRDHIDPLRLFVDSQTAIRHGVDFEADRTPRRDLLSAALDAIERDDPVAASTALDAFSVSFIDALSPGTAQTAAQPQLRS